ncbi:MAG: hypothetical protein ACRYFZ_00695 [Janthinobacterium lividum]
MSPYDDPAVSAGEIADYLHSNPLPDTMATYQENWDEFWAELCLNPDGSANLDQIKRELSDFREIMDSVSEVYDHLTKGRISKPNTCAKAVIGEVEALQQQDIDDAVAEVAEEPNSIKTYQGWEDGPEMPITEYLKPMDEVDEEMFMHFAEAVPAQYHVGNLMQSGEAEFKDRGRYHYLTFAGYGEPERYYYLGILPPFKQPK